MPDCTKRVKAKRLCQMHYRRLQRRGDPSLAWEKGRYPRPSTEERFWNKVEKTDGCWLWTAALNADGYGLFLLKNDGRMKIAHRIAFRWLVGPIPDGMELHHLCHTTNCVNPAHLKPVTRTEHIRLTRPRTNCIYGHPLEGDNLYVAPDGKRQCRICIRRRNQEYRQRKRAAAP